MERFSDLYNSANPNYLNQLLNNLNNKTDIIFLNYSRAETSWARILYFEKNQMTFSEAFGLLALKLLFFDEEWSLNEEYSLDDMSLWTKNFLNLKYDKTKFIEKVELQDNQTSFLNIPDIIGIELNSKRLTIDKLTVELPLFYNKIQKMAASRFKSITEELYIETEEHYILYNWFTTA